MDHSIDETLKSLHTAEIDALNGYEEARHDAEGKGMSPLFQEMITLHTRNGADLNGALGARSEPSDNKGSFMSTVHRTIMDVRALFGGLGESVLTGLIDGEKRNVHHYEKAIATPDLTASVRAVLVSNLSRLEGAIAKMEAPTTHPSVGEPRISAL
jgi:uncharacterized protein (TIGR02284 family)